MNKIELFKLMLEKDPDNSEAWYLLGEEYLQTTQLQQALHAFSKALTNAKMETLVLDSLRKRLIGEQEGVALSGGNSQSESFEAQNEDDFWEEESLDEELLDEHQPEEPTETEHSANVHTLEKTHQPAPASRFKVMEGGKKDNVVHLEDRAPEKVTFQNVGGLDDLKHTIEMKIIKPFMNPGLFSKFRKKSGGGILLYGPPGCGKTFIAQATAGEMGANFYPVHITEILDPYFGMSERNLHNIFETARANRPAVLFFDEIDTLGYSRSKSSSDLMRPLVDSMLTELQSINTSTDKLLVIGATNMPWDVDSAFKRPGRFDKLVFVPPPDKPARKIIFGLKLRGKPIEDDIDLALLAEKTEHYSGADIENVIEIATENVLTEIMRSNTERLIAMEDLLEAIKTTKPSTLEWLTTIKNYIKYANQAGQYTEVAEYLK